MAELSEQAKLRLVTLLARFSGPSEAARIVSKEFGVTLNRTQAWKYDATRPACRISPKLKGVFFEVRDRWLTRMSEIGVANKAHRLRCLDRLVAKLMDRGDYHGALKALELAAREVGGVFEKHANQSAQDLVATDGGHDGHPYRSASPREELQLRLQSLVETVGLNPTSDIGQRPSPVS